jgi:hypothetical protein
VGLGSCICGFVFSEKEPVRLDGRGVGACALRGICFGALVGSSELVLLCERVLLWADFGWLEGDMNTMLREGLDEGLAEASSAIG